jgi:hypothetical protein
MTYRIFSVRVFIWRAGRRGNIMVRSPQSNPFMTRMENKIQIGHELNRYGVPNSGTTHDNLLPRHYFYRVEYLLIFELET